MGANQKLIDDDQFGSAGGLKQLEETCVRRMARRQRARQSDCELFSVLPRGENRHGNARALADGNLNAVLICYAGFRLPPQVVGESSRGFLQAREIEFRQLAGEKVFQ